MVDLRLSKSLNRTRSSVDGFTASLNSENYTAGTTVTINLSGARAERIFKKQLKNVTRGVSKGKYSTYDPRNIMYDYKWAIWTWRLKGKYTSTGGYTNVLNFVTDCKVLFEDGGTMTLTVRDKTYTVNVIDAQFVHTGGEEHVVDFVIDFMEGEERT